MDSVWRKKIKEKLLKIQLQNSNYFDQIQAIIQRNNETFKTVNDYITALGDKKQFKEVFLKPIYNFDTLREELDELRVRLINDSHIYGDFNEGEIKDIIDKMNSNLTETRTNKFVLKFLLTNCLVKYDFFRSLFNPFFKYGTFHAALAIDNVILEWDDQSIVCPHIDVMSLLISVNIENKNYQNKFSFLMNLVKNAKNFYYRLFVDSQCFGEIATLIENQLDKVADVCVHFNGYREYSLLNNNCQTFVDAVFAKLGLELKFEGELQNVIGNLKKNGEIDFEKDGFKLKDNVFTTRKQLDDFVKSGFQELEKNEKNLLFTYKNILDYYLKSDEFKLDEKYITTDEATKLWQQLIIAYLNELANNQ
jgi:hypothetical protein